MTKSQKAEILAAAYHQLVAIGNDLNAFPAVGARSIRLYLELIKSGATAARPLTTGELAERVGSLTDTNVGGAMSEVAAIVHYYAPGISIRRRREARRCYYWVEIDPVIIPHPAALPHSPQLLHSA